MKLSKSIIIYLTAVILIISWSMPVFAADALREKPTAEKMLVDVMLVRPLGFIATVIGSTFFIISLPLSISGGNTQDVMNELIKKPAAFTFTRPVGELDY